MKIRMSSEVRDWLATLLGPEDDFTGYDLAGFLSAYFPGEEAEVRAGAARLLGLDRS